MFFRFIKKLKAFGWLFIDAGIKWSEDNCQRFAASLSYSTVFSLAPLLLIIVAVLGLYYGNDVARMQIVEQTHELLGPQVSVIVNSLILSASRPFHGFFASFVALFAFLIGATTVLVELRHALNTVWGFAQPEQKTDLSIWRHILRFILVRLFTVLMILVMSLMILALLFVTTYLSTVNWIPTQTLGALSIGSFSISLGFNTLISVAGATVFFFVMMWLLPAHRPPKRNLWPGAFVAALLFHLGKTLMGLYLARAMTTSIYGAASSLVVLMLWVYFSAAIFLYGAELSAVIRISKLDRIQRSIQKSRKHEEESA